MQCKFPPRSRIQAEDVCGKEPYFSPANVSVETRKATEQRCKNLMLKEASAKEWCQKGRSRIGIERSLVWH
jgi:hypothetical protein